MSSLIVYDISRDTTRTRSDWSGALSEEGLREIRELGVRFRCPQCEMPSKEFPCEFCGGGSEPEFLEWLNRQT